MCKIVDGFEVECMKLFRDRRQKKGSRKDLVVSNAGVALGFFLSLARSSS